MQKLLSYILAGALLVPAATKMGGVAHFFANFNYYNLVLCINKDTPELNCHGTCQLSEQLADENPTQEPLPLPFSLSLELEPFFTSDQKISITDFYMISKGQLPPYLFAYADVAAEVPHPPPPFLG